MTRLTKDGALWGSKNPTEKPATWFCNKCGQAGQATTRENAEKQHEAKSPQCDYLPAWNWVKTEGEE